MVFVANVETERQPPSWRAAIADSWGRPLLVYNTTSRIQFYSQIAEPCFANSHTPTLFPANTETLAPFPAATDLKITADCGFVRLLWHLPEPCNPPIALQTLLTSMSVSSSLLRCLSGVLLTLLSSYGAFIIQTASMISCLFSCIWAICF